MEKALGLRSENETIFTSKMATANQDVVCMTVFISILSLRVLIYYKLIKLKPTAIKLLFTFFLHSIGFIYPVYLPFASNRGGVIL